jgi:acyl-CoA thioester hydrolase
VKYLEVARCALLDDIGHNYLQMKASGYAWPVIDLQLRYVQAARFGQRISVRADLVEWQNRLLIHYLIQDASTGQRLTRASTVQVAVHLASGEMQLVSPNVFTDAVERRLRDVSQNPSSSVAT